MVAPLLQAQVDIDAPAAKVWELISDFRRSKRLVTPYGRPKNGVDHFCELVHRVDRYLCVLECHLVVGR